MLDRVPHEDHLLILEDTPEIQELTTRVTHLVADEAIAQKTLKSYCRHAMRLRPDRIILGELRGEEVVSFLLCLNTGHRGVLTTLHANNAKEALERVALLFHLYHEREGLDSNQLMAMICKNVDWVIHLEKGAVQEIIEVTNAENGIPYYQTLFRQCGEGRLMSA